MSIFSSIQTRGSNSSEYRKGWRTILLNVVLVFLAGLARKHGFEVDTGDLAVVIGGNTGMAASYALSRTAVKRGKIARDTARSEAEIIKAKVQSSAIPASSIPEPVREPFPRPSAHEGHPGYPHPLSEAYRDDESTDGHTRPQPPAYFGS